MQAAAAGALSLAERSYPTSEVRGSGLECQAVTGTGMAERSYLASEVKGGSLEKQPHA